MTERWTIGCTESAIHGPYDSAELRSDAAGGLVVTVEDCACCLDIVDGLPIVYPFTDDEF